MDASEVEISAELTPNPNTLKFVVNKTLIEKGTRNFPTKESAKNSTLPALLFENETVSGVMIGPDFVTVTKREELDWPTIASPIVETLRTFLASGETPVSAEDQVAAMPERSGIEQQIIEILDNEIRPAVARDGGDIVFYGYENGVVKLHLQGSCSSCPSSVLTLKMGIENRLKQVLPEIREVLQV